MYILYMFIVYIYVKYITIKFIIIDHPNFKIVVQIQLMFQVVRYINYLHARIIKKIYSHDSNRFLHIWYIWPIFNFLWKDLLRIYISFEIIIINIIGNRDLFIYLKSFMVYRFAASAIKMQEIMHNITKQIYYYTYSIRHFIKFIFYKYWKLY